MIRRTYKGIDNITADDKQEVISIMQQVQLNPLRADRQSVKRLFSLYHEYVYKSPKDMGCSSCVRFVLNFWNKQQKQWEQNN